MSDVIARVDAPRGGRLLRSGVSYEHIELRTGRVGELVLSRPEARNAMTPEMGAEVARAVTELNACDELRAVLVRGAGKTFSAGGDFSLLEAKTGAPGETNRREMRAFYDLYLSIRDVHVPTIAVLHGAAIGAGLCFAMACDIRLGAQGAKLGVTFVRVGLHPGMGASYLLPRLVGAGKAAELLLTGRVIDADEACCIGLVNAVHPAEALLPAAHAMAEEIAGAAPIAVAQAKATLARGADLSLTEALEREAACQAIDYASADMAEAVAAFREKREPVFRAR